ncbi:type II toxin-antitoxin system RelE/ParE family toxin [Flavobacterium longum]|uniref:type II toxin-antitoxin system RelE/ParE family toxin n=1 Tax=Flavobacterium longum TaxID=1299340 RepID=UPI0039E8BD09
MEITFEDSNLRKYANDDRLAVKKLGQRCADLYKRRLDDLQAAASLEDVRYLPGRFHELKANRKGKWACDLVHPYRLIFTPHERPIPTDGDGKYIWAEIKGIEIIEIEDYH